MTASPLPRSVARALPAAMASRLAINATIRGPFVFLNQIASGLGWSTQSLANVLGLRELAGLLSLPFGRWIDRGHERAGMVGTLALASVASLAVPVAARLGAGIGVVAVVLTVAALAAFLFSTAQTGWLGHRVPFASRGRAIGLIEGTWGASFLLAVPVLGLVVNRWGWSAMFFAMSGCLAVAAVLSARVLPADEARGDPDGAAASVRTRDVLATVDRSNLFGLAAYFLVQPIAQMVVFGAEGRWFNEELGFSTTATAVAHIAIGVAEVIGTSLTAVFADRIGKRRAALIGSAGVIPAALLLSAAAGSPLWGIASLALVAIALEFGFVSALPLATELNPAASGAFAAGTFTIITLGRTIGAPVANIVFDGGSFQASAWAAAVLMVGATGLLAFFTREPH